MEKTAKRVSADDFERMFSAAEREIYRTAYLYVKNRDDALDVVQETAYRCYRSYAGLRDKSYFRTWAVRTAINCALDHLRKSGRETPLEDAEPVTEPIGNVEDEVISKLTLMDLLERLDENEKSVILLRYHHGLTFAEVAKALKIPLGTAKSLCYRAIGKLKNKEDCL